MLRQISTRILSIAGLVAALTLGVALPQATAETVLKVKLDSGIKQLDPIWTTAYAARSHGFLVYDTLFGLGLVNSG